MRGIDPALVSSNKHRLHAQIEIIRSACLEPAARPSTRTSSSVFDALRVNPTAQSDWVAEATLQISNKLSLPEQESRRRSPKVPRGAPQCRHLIRVEAGASSLQSKKIPKPSQMPQTI